MTKLAARDRRSHDRGQHMGPGLRKATHPRVYTTRSIVLERLDVNATRDWLDEASVVSEGAVHDGSRYYGSSYIRIEDHDLDAGALVKLVDADPHLRLRMLRVAHREAASRAGGELDTLRASIVIRPSDRGISVAIDVEADIVRRVDDLLDDDMERVR